jgi:hypothetical protein
MGSFVCMCRLTQDGINPTIINGFALIPANVERTRYFCDIAQTLNAVDGCKKYEGCIGDWIGAEKKCRWRQVI